MGHGTPKWRIHCLATNYILFIRIDGMAVHRSEFMHHHSYNVGNSVIWYSRA